MTPIHRNSLGGLVSMLSWHDRTAAADDPADAPVEAANA
jgi:hypothetical protein